MDSSATDDVVDGGATKSAPGAEPRERKKRPRRGPGRARVLTFALSGVDALPVEVQVAAEAGYPGITLVGLPDTAVRESRERIQAAFKRLEAKLNERHFTVNLAPAEVRKEGAGFDLPIALGLLLALKRLRPEALQGIAVAGELSLDGEIHPVRGALALALTSARMGYRGLILPEANRVETAAVADLPIFAARSLPELVVQLETGTLEPVAVQRSQLASASPASSAPDLSLIRGQRLARRALEIAAAGGHNILFIGPPGSGKTLLAQSLPGILPPFADAEALEATLVHSVAGLLPAGTACLSRRPFRAPHHTITPAGMVGGGLVPRPGEVSLAHRGVLFLDELPEFRTEVLNLLRQPVEEGQVVLSRLARSVRLPCRFMLVGAMNPCPCGFLGHPRRGCRCTPSQIRRYQGRVSGPLLDRIDLQIQVPAVSPREVTAVSGCSVESSLEVRARVTAARALQRARFSGLPALHANAQMSAEHLEPFCPLTPPVRALLQSAMERLSLSARAAHRALRVARTIADLAAAPQIESAHLAEAIAYRGWDREGEEAGV